jgi:hypothetical protein
MHRDPGLNILGVGIGSPVVALHLRNDWVYGQGSTIKVRTFNIEGKLSRIESRRI